MKKLLFICFLIVTGLTFTRCNNGGGGQECLTYSRPDNPTGWVICSECGGWQLTDNGGEQIPPQRKKPAPKKGAIDGNGFNWETGKTIK